MKIILKNVTGSQENDRLLWEIKKYSGLKEGSIVEAQYSPKNNSCSFTHAGADCVAWLNQTCEEYKEESQPTINKINT